MSTVGAQTSSTDGNDVSEATAFPGVTHQAWPDGSSAVVQRSCLTPRKMKGNLQSLFGSGPCVVRQVVGAVSGSGIGSNGGGTETKQAYHK